MSQEKKQDEIVSFGSDFLTNQFQKFFLTSELNAKNLAKALAQIELMTKEKQDSFTITKARRATVTGTTKPKTPTFEFKNPLDKDIKVNEISFVPSSGMKTNGILEIQIDGIPVFEHNAVADFTDITDLKIKFHNGKLLPRQKKVQVLIWTDDGTSSSLLVVIQFGD